MFKIKNRCDMSTTMINVIYRTHTHQKRCYKSHNRYTYLQILCIFNISKTCVDCKGTKQYQTKVIRIKSQPLSKAIFFLPKSMVNPSCKTLCTSNIFDSNGTIQIYYQNYLYDFLYILLLCQTNYNLANFNLFINLIGILRFGVWS